MVGPPFRDTQAGDTALVLTVLEYRRRRGLAPTQGMVLGQLHAAAVNGDWDFLLGALQSAAGSRARVLEAALRVAEEHRQWRVAVRVMRRAVAARSSTGAFAAEPLPPKVCHGFLRAMRAGGQEGLAARFLAIISSAEATADPVEDSGQVEEQTRKQKVRRPARQRMTPSEGGEVPAGLRGIALGDLSSFDMDSGLRDLGGPSGEEEPDATEEWGNMNAATLTRPSDSPEPQCDEKETSVFECSDFESSGEARGRGRGEDDVESLFAELAAVKLPSSRDVNADPVS